MEGQWTVRLVRIYSILFAHYKDPEWWPGETPFEIAVGAVLTQNTAWNNVEKAIKGLKSKGSLSLSDILSYDPNVLAEVIRPAGNFNRKSIYLRNLCSFIQVELGGELTSLIDIPLPQARNSLLSIKGIGKETADSMLCYAVGLPVLVIDAYTRRILGRIFGEELLEALPGRGYDDLATFLTSNLMGDTQFYNRFHALMVILAKDNCRKTPICMTCPLSGKCSFQRIGAVSQGDEMSSRK